MKSRGLLCNVVLPLAFILALLAWFVLIVGCEPPKGLPAPQPIKPPCAAVVVAFTASWCAPCQRAKPTLIEMKAGGVNVQIVDIDEHPELARQYGVTSVPAYFVYVCGKEAVRTQDISAVVSLVRSRCK